MTFLWIWKAEEVCSCFEMRVYMINYELEIQGKMRYTVIDSQEAWMFCWFVYPISSAHDRTSACVTL